MKSIAIGLFFSIWCAAALLLLDRGFVGVSQARADAPATAPSVPKATARDLKVACVMDRANFKTKDKPQQVAIIGYVMNTSNHAIAITAHGLRGPVYVAKGPIENRPVPWDGGDDTIVLQPGQTFGKTLFIDGAGDNGRMEADYVIYSPGHEGEADYIQSVIQSDGTITNYRNAR